MDFYFSAYSSPLLFGFIQAWVYAVLLWIRGRREERLSDILLGGVLVGMAFNLWEYMLGFGGIDILWRELEFFPRTLGYLFPVLCYFYLKTQFNADFRFSRRDAWHLLPFLLYTAYHVGVFSRGPAFVKWWQTTVHGPYYLGDLEFWLGVGIDLFYLFQSLRLYRQYRQWAQNQFSETETISFRWFRNFLMALTITSLFSFGMDLLSSALQLTFWQDWWDELAKVVLIYYVSINGYAQVQPGRRLAFQPEEAPVVPVAQPLVPAGEPDSPGMVEEPLASGSTSEEPVLADERLPLRDTLLAFMESEKPYLEPELTLADLARRLHTNPVVLSQVINVGLGRNFNDFVNEYRVEAFKQLVRDPANRHLSYLGLALECGFNSKATFNRAFKKRTGLAPNEFARMA